MGNVYTGMSVGIGFILFFLLLAIIWTIFKNLKKKMMPGNNNSDMAADISSFQVNENRSDQRVGISWPVSLETVNGIIKAETKDLSRSGAFVKCSKPLLPGENFRITIEIPDQEPLVLNSEVVWSNGGFPEEKVVTRGMGIRFLKNLDKDIEKLKMSLEAYLESIKKTTLVQAVIL